MRRSLVDASVFITLSEIGHADLLCDLVGDLRMPEAVADEIRDDPARSELQAATDDWLTVRRTIHHDDASTDPPAPGEFVREAATHLGVDDVESGWHGDVALLSLALSERTDDEVVVISDDKPLRKTCAALGIDVSGTIGVLVASVERNDLTPTEAKDALQSVDRVGARLSAGLVRRAERLIDEAANDR